LRASTWDSIPQQQILRALLLANNAIYKTTPDAKIEKIEKNTQK